MEPGWNEKPVVVDGEGVSPAGRREILSALSVKEERLSRAIVRCRNGRITLGEVDASSRSILLRHAEFLDSRRAGALWGERKKRDRAMQSCSSFRKALELKGNSLAGQTTFSGFAVLPSLNGIGNEVGPNLALAATPISRGIVG